MPLLAFGTGEGLLGYGICVPCSKRLPGVRDASSSEFFKLLYLKVVNI